MSMYDHDPPTRQCRHCGAALDRWFCAACGGDSFESVSRLYVAELASPWQGRRHTSRRTGRRHLRLVAPLEDQREVTAA